MTLEQGRADLASLVGGRPTEIALTPSDSVAWVKAWWGWVTGGNIEDGSVVLVDRLSYHSHYAALVQTQELAGFRIEVLPSTPDGTIDIARAEIDADAAAVCATMIGTHCGNVNPIAELGALTTDAGVPLFVDACQALGQLVLDVDQLQCQVLTATGRKFLRGPRGTGMLWISEALVDAFRPPGLDATNTTWRSDDGMAILPGMKRFEEYEASYASLVGLAAAARQAVELDMTAIEPRVLSLADLLRGQLSEQRGVTVLDKAERRSGIVTFTVEGHDPQAVVDTARRRDITIHSSSAAWAALDMEAKGLTEVVRASPHYFNTEDEIGQLVEAIQPLTA